MKRSLTIILASAMLLSVSACANKGEVTDVSKNTAEMREILKDMPIDKLSENIDKIEDDYKSFELQPIESDDFFIGKTLKLVAVVDDHKMSKAADLNMSMEIKNDTLKATYPDSEKKDEMVTITNNVYAISEPVTTKGERKYIIVSFGGHVLSNENKEYELDSLALIKMRDDVDMGKDKADTYVLLVENKFPDKLEIFKVED